MFILTIRLNNDWIDREFKTYGEALKFLIGFLAYTDTIPEKDNLNIKIEIYFTNNPLKLS